MMVVNDEPNNLRLTEFLLVRAVQARHSIAYCPGNFAYIVIDPRILVLDQILWCRKCKPVPDLEWRAHHGP